MSGQQNQSADQSDAPEGDEFELVEEVQFVTEDVVVEVPHEYIEEKYVTTMKLMPTVKAKYPFEGQGMNMVKGEVSAPLCYDKRVKRRCVK